MNSQEILRLLTNKQNTSVLDGIKSVISSAKAVNDPNALMEKMAANPNMSKAIDYVKQHGGDPKAACFELLKSNGIDPNTVANLIKGG